MVTGSPGRKLWRLGGIDHGKAVSLSANAGEDSARLTPILDGSLAALRLFLRAGLLLHLVQGILGFCAGTALANSVLRWMGCQIGRRTIVIQPMQCSDWNAVSVGNDCVIGGFLQFHTLENMMLKVKRTHIRDRCAVNFGATVMGGAIIERDTTLLPLSLVLKEMKLSTATYEGSPVEPVSGSTLFARQNSSGPWNQSFPG